MIAVLAISYLSPLCGGAFGTNTSELNVMNVPPMKVQRLFGPIKIEVPDVLSVHDFFENPPECDPEKKYLHVDKTMKSYVKLIIVGVVCLTLTLLGISVFAMTQTSIQTSTQSSTQNSSHQNYQNHQDSKISHHSKLLAKLCKLTVIPFSIFGAIFIFLSVFVSIKAVSPLSRAFSRYVFLNFNMTHVHMLVTDDKLALLDVMKRIFLAVNTFLLVSLNLLQSLLVIAMSMLMFAVAGRGGGYQSVSLYQYSTVPYSTASCKTQEKLKIVTPTQGVTTGVGVTNVRDPDGDIPCGYSETCGFFELLNNLG